MRQKGRPFSDFIKNEKKGLPGIPVLFLEKKRIGQDLFLVSDIVPVKIKALSKMFFVAFRKRSLSHLSGTAYEGHLIILLDGFLDDLCGGPVNHVSILDHTLKKSRLFQGSLETCVR